MRRVSPGLPGSVLALALACMSPAAPADEVPFATFNQSPLVQIYGLPALGSARVVRAGETRVGLFYAVANHFLSAANGTEFLELDGETHRTTLGVFHGIGRLAEIGIELPHISHGGGYLDGFIRNWHDAFGLPQGGRDTTPPDRLIYRYHRNGIDRINVTQSTAGAGDVRIGAGLQLARAEDGERDTTVRVSVKFPTGDSAQLHGSGAADVAAWLSSECRCTGALGWYGGGGLLWLGDGDVLGDQQRRAVAFGSAGTHWRAFKRLTLTAQLDAHTSFYRGSDLRPLASPSVQLVLGGTWSVGRKLDLEVAVSEDLVVDTAPDVLIQIGMRASF